MTAMVKLPGMYGKHCRVDPDAVDAIISSEVTADGKPCCDLVFRSGPMVGFIQSVDEAHAALFPEPEATTAKPAGWGHE